MISIEEVPSHTALISIQKVKNFRFDIACKDALTALLPFIESNNLISQLDSHRISICPQDPQKNSPCQYEPGFIIQGDISLIKSAIAKTNQPSLSIREFKAGRWVKYLHVGNYAGLSNAWNSAYKEFYAANFKQHTVNAPYERYLDLTCGDGTGDNLRTEIWIPIEK